jgi:predicted GNAT superfamily acetyltransferase
MELRTLATVDEFRQVFELEQEIWGYETAEDSVPVMMLLVTSRIGGLVIGAFDRGRLAGFAYALPGIRNGAPFQWSHMLGVVPAYRSSGLGWRIKLEQRRLVMASGLDLIAWTYDPLQALNAHLNFAKLGTLAGEYHLDVYPESTSTLHAGTPTDRLIAEWWIRSDRVQARLDAVERGAAGDRADADGDAAAPVTVNRVRDGGEWIAPDGHDLSAESSRLAVTIPTGFTEMQQRDVSLAREWRSATREIFTTYLPRGYQVVDFILDRAGRRGSYILALRRATL